VEISPELTIFSKFIRFFDIPNDEYAVSIDKCFREKDKFLFNLISFGFFLLYHLGIVSISFFTSVYSNNDRGIMQWFHPKTY